MFVFMEKKKYKVKKPIAWGVRREVGEIIELTEDDFKAFGEEYLEPVIEVATATEKGRNWFGCQVLKASKELKNKIIKLLKK